MDLNPLDFQKDYSVTQNMSKQVQDPSQTLDSLTNSCWQIPSKRGKTVLWPDWIVILRILDDFYIISQICQKTRAKCTRARQCQLGALPRRFATFWNLSGRLIYAFCVEQTTQITWCDISRQNVTRGGGWLRVP